MSFFPKDAEYVAMADAYGPECAACEGDDDAAHVDGCRWIATQKATPAPIDPSKVKPGDTVTLSLEGAHVTDVVASWERNPASGHYRAYLTHDPDPFDTKPFRLVGPASYTLTAHQPAPEPEPEWKPGTVHAVRLAGGADHFHAWVIDLDEGARAFMDDGGNSWAEGELHDVRPLVVIDPADVDVNALLDSALARLRDDPHVPTTYTVLKTALSVLGIEAAS